MSASASGRRRAFLRTPPYRPFPQFNTRGCHASSCAHVIKQASRPLERHQLRAFSHSDCWTDRSAPSAHYSCTASPALDCWRLPQVILFEAAVASRNIGHVISAAISTCWPWSRRSLLRYFLLRNRHRDRRLPSGVQGTVMCMRVGSNPGGSLGLRMAGLTCRMELI